MDVSSTRTCLHNTTHANQDLSPLLPCSFLFLSLALFSSLFPSPNLQGFTFFPDGHARARASGSVKRWTYVSQSVSHTYYISALIYNTIQTIVIGIGIGMHAVVVLHGHGIFFFFFPSLRATCWS